MKTVFRIAALTLFFLHCAACFAQTAEQPTSQSAAAVSPVPSNPAAFLAKAAKVNGLGDTSVKPWHIKVSYQSFDSDGDPEHSGIFEEFWASARKYKRSYTSDNFTQTDFATDHGLYRSGNQAWPGYLEALVSKNVLEPIPVEVDQSQIDFEKVESTFGPVSLSCIRLVGKTNNVKIRVIGRPGSELFPRFCFESGKLLLRFASQGGGHSDTVYNNIFFFHDHYIARDVKINDGGKLRLSFHVEILEDIATANEPEFAPGTDAVGPLGNGSFVQSGLLHNLLQKPAIPNYPESARRAHIQGDVVVQATIGKNGHVIAAKAVSGPFALQEAAVETVRKMEFRPFLILGQPVEVETKFSIGFHIA